jgi:hypothetical protein
MDKFGSQEEALTAANEFVAEFGIKLVPKEEGGTDLLI